MLQKNILQKLPTVVVFFCKVPKLTFMLNLLKLLGATSCLNIEESFLLFQILKGWAFLYLHSPTLNQSNSKKLTWTHPKLWKLAWPSHCNQIAKNWEFVLLCYSLNLWSIAAYMECSCKRYLLWQGKKGHLIWPRNIKITILIAYWNMGGACVVVRGLSH